MYPIYKKIINAQALKSHLKAPLMPDDNLAIGDDEKLDSVPLVIFRDQHEPPTRPVVQDRNQIAYEKLAVKGSGDTLSLDDFVTDDFSVGQALDSP